MRKTVEKVRHESVESLADQTLALDNFRGKPLSKLGAADAEEHLLGRHMWSQRVTAWPGRNTTQQAFG
jgi:hypothetical protein